MPRYRMVMELGMGTDIRGQDYTKAAVRALQNALRQNSLTVAQAFGVEPQNMYVTAIIGVQQPNKVDVASVAAVFPYGQPSVNVEFGGMDTAKDDGSPGTIMANAAVIVELELPAGASS